MRAAAEIVLAVALLAVCARAQEVNDVEFLKQASVRVQEYSETFHDLTATEIATIQSMDLAGRAASFRTVISALIIYRSQADASRSIEYRDVESVDGKTVKDHDKRALKLLESLTDARSATDELERITREGSRYNHNVKTVNLTLHQGLPLMMECRHAFRFYFMGKEDVGRIPTRVYRYEQVEPCQNFRYRLGLPHAFEEGPRTHRGTLWLEASTGRLVREHREVYVERADDPASLMKAVDMTFEYQPSSFGILVPERISIASFRVVSAKQGQTPVTVPLLNLTQSYGQFSRFEVTTQQHVVYPDAPQD